MQMWVPLGCSVRSRRPPERPGPAWYSTAPGGGGRRRRHGLCVYGRGSVARRHWPAPKPQLVAPGPLQYRRGGIRTSSATPGPPTARTNAPPSSPHPATTRSLRGRVIWSLVFVEDTSRVRGRSFTRGDMPRVRGQDFCTHSRRRPPSVHDAPVDEATSHLLTQPFSLEVSRLWTRGSSRLRMGLGRRSRSGNRRGCLARTVVRFIAGVFMAGVQWDRLAQGRLQDGGPQHDRQIGGQHRPRPHEHVLHHGQGREE